MPGLKLPYAECLSFANFSVPAFVERGSRVVLRVCFFSVSLSLSLSISFSLTHSLTHFISLFQSLPLSFSLKALSTSMHPHSLRGAQRSFLVQGFFILSLTHTYTHAIFLSRTHTHTLFIPLSHFVSCPSLHSKLCQVQCAACGGKYYI